MLEAIQNSIKEFMVEHGYRPITYDNGYSKDGRAVFVYLLQYNFMKPSIMVEVCGHAHRLYLEDPNLFDKLLGYIEE